jgi:hypothetical protein
MTGVYPFWLLVFRDCEVDLILPVDPTLPRYSAMCLLRNFFRGLFQRHEKITFSIESSPEMTLLEEESQMPVSVSSQRTHGCCEDSISRRLVRTSNIRPREIYA